MRRNESRPGSAAYERELAECLAARRESGIGLGPTDITIAERALRSRANRGLRRAFVGSLVGAAILTSAAVGIEDRNADGRGDLRDLALVARDLIAGAPKVCAMPAIEELLRAAAITPSAERRG